MVHLENTAGVVRVTYIRKMHPHVKQILNSVFHVCIVCHNYEYNNDEENIFKWDV